MTLEDTISAMIYAALHEHGTLPDAVFLDPEHVNIISKERETKAYSSLLQLEFEARSVCGLPALPSLLPTPPLLAWQHADGMYYQTPERQEI